MIVRAALGTLCLAALPALASAQTGTLSNTDKAFLKSTAEMDMTEAHLGEMARDQASNDAVKNLGQTLVDNHTKDYQHLTALAEKTGASIPKGIDIRRDRGIETLMKEKGGAFDRHFVNDVVQQHRRALDEYQREASRGENADLKAYAQSMVPTVQEHLDKAVALQKSAGGTGSGSAERSKR